VLKGEIDPMKKVVKPTSHGQKLIQHRDLVDKHRRSAFYNVRRTWAKAILTSPFPRICSHRGLKLVCPENTIPAFGAAIAVGAHEIEFDLWLSRDGVAVVCHDPDVTRTTDGEGVVTEMQWKEICSLDAGINGGEEWRGTRIPRFEEVLGLADGRVGLNIHIKTPGRDARLVRLVCDVLRDRGITDIAYVAGAEDVLEAALGYAPEVPRACLASQNQPDSQVDIALRYKCKRVQFGRSVSDDAMRRAGEAGLIRNLFFSDDPGEARLYAERGIDVILSNCANTLISNGLPRLRPPPDR